MRNNLTAEDDFAILSMVNQQSVMGIEELLGYLVIYCGEMTRINFRMN